MQEQMFENLQMFSELLKDFKNLIYVDIQMRLRCIMQKVNNDKQIQSYHEA